MHLNIIIPQFHSRSFCIGKLLSLLSHLRLCAPSWIQPCPADFDPCRYPCFPFLQPQCFCTLFSPSLLLTMAWQYLEIPVTLDNKPPLDDLRTPDLKSTVNAVALLEFYSSDPALWFLCTEAQFHIHSITRDETKFCHILSALDAETSARASQVIAKAVPSFKYQSLKDFLICTYSPSRWKHVECILAISELGERKPFTLANQILTWLSEHTADIFHHVFLRPLPHLVQDALTSSEFTDLESLSDRADEIMAGPHHPAPQSAQPHF